MPAVNWPQSAAPGLAWPQFNLVQTVPLVFGGHNNPGYMVSRWFGGQLDDLVIFNSARLVRKGEELEHYHPAPVTPRKGRPTPPAPQAEPVPKPA